MPSAPRLMDKKGVIVDASRHQSQRDCQPMPAALSQDVSMIWMNLIGPRVPWKVNKNTASIAIVPKFIS